MPEVQELQLMVILQVCLLSRSGEDSAIPFGRVVTSEREFAKWMRLVKEGEPRKSWAVSCKEDSSKL